MNAQVDSRFITVRQLVYEVRFIRNITGKYAQKYFYLFIQIFKQFLESFKYFKTMLNFMTHIGVMKEL